MKHVTVGHKICVTTRNRESQVDCSYDGAIAGGGAKAGYDTIRKI